VNTALVLHFVIRFFFVFGFLEILFLLETKRLLAVFLFNIFINRHKVNYFIQYCIPLLDKCRIAILTQNHVLVSKYFDVKFHTFVVSLIVNQLLSC